MEIRDADIAPFEIQSEVFHVAIHMAVKLVSVFIFDPARGG